MSSSDEHDLTPFDYELPQTPLSVMNGWVVRLQAVAIVTALLAQVEASFVGGLEPASPDPTASDTALRIFAYAGLILNLGATLSSVLLLLAITSVPTAARRLYMSCSHGYPRRIFLHHNKKDSEKPEDKTSSPASGAADTPHFPRLQHRRPNVPDTLKDMKSLNQFLLRGDTEGKILHVFGVARGWRFLLQHCIFCFLAGCVCAFVHVGILVWVSESTTVASVMMPMALIGFIPPLIVFFFAMDSPSCKHCHEKKNVSTSRLSGVEIS